MPCVALAAASIGQELSHAVLSTEQVPTASAADASAFSWCLFIGQSAGIADLSMEQVPSALVLASMGQEPCLAASQLVLSIAQVASLATSFALACIGQSAGIAALSIACVSSDLAGCVVAFLQPQVSHAKTVLAVLKLAVIKHNARIEDIQVERDMMAMAENSC